MKPVALTIAGSDPSGGAGLQADLKTFHQFGVYGMSVVTLLTVQNTEEVSSVDPLDPAYVEKQLRAVLSDIPPQAAKTGALGTPEIIETVARWAARLSCPLVVDPVMISKHGASLMAEEARQVLAKRLLPGAFLVTPNLPEASVLCGGVVDSPDSMRDAARTIAELGPSAVLIKGGHLDGDALDLLYYEGRFEEFRAARIDSNHTHGTGCTYSAAIAAKLAQGASLLEAVHAGKRFITRAIESSPGLGHGCGPVNHHSKVD
jgi:hydroxymethylpyrimidine/phosphomethylpyrimidine kinase